MFILNKFLEKKIIQDISNDTAIKKAFIEKDWYVVQLIKHLNDFDDQNKINRKIKILFSGGTSLSKGFKIIHRFSEDIDFVLSTPDTLTRSDRRAFGKSIIEHIKLDDKFSIEDSDVKKSNAHHFFNVPINYECNFLHNSLRTHLKFEMNFTQHQLPPKSCSIRSIYAEYIGCEPETKIDCISPIETAANKISALSWRVVVRDRDSEKDDPAIIRHLHDLAALKKYIDEEQSQFTTCARQSLLEDKKKRGGKLNENMPIPVRLQTAFNLLSTDSIYREEYKKFVDTMSYANKDQQIDFDHALSVLEEIIQLDISVAS